MKGRPLSESPNPEQRILGYFCDKFKELTGFIYPCNFGKDGQIIKKLYQSQGENENLMMDCIDIFFEMAVQDTFIKSNMSVGMLSTKFPAILIKLSEEMRAREKEAEK